MPVRLQLRRGRQKKLRLIPGQHLSRFRQLRLITESANPTGRLTPKPLHSFQILPRTNGTQPRIGSTHPILSLFSDGTFSHLDLHILQKQFGAGDPHAEATRLIRWFAQILRLQLHRKNLFPLSLHLHNDPVPMGEPLFDHSEKSGLLIIVHSASEKLEDRTHQGESGGDRP